MRKIWEVENEYWVQTIADALRMSFLLQPSSSCEGNSIFADIKQVLHPTLQSVQTKSSAIIINLFLCILCNYVLPNLAP